MVVITVITGLIVSFPCYQTISLFCSLVLELVIYFYQSYAIESYLYTS